MKTIFWLVGEKSGDQHAAEVIKQLNKDDTPYNHTGIGGPLMQTQGLKTLFPFEKFCIMGFVEVIKHLMFFIKVENKIKKYLIKNKPDIVILVDYPGLNLRIAKMAHKLKIKTLYYICPQFWAWKQHRIWQLKKYCDYVAAIIPFEDEALKAIGIKSKYVGHPIIEEIKIKYSKEEFANKYSLDKTKKWIAFFPGSRQIEVKRLLPIYIKTINKNVAEKHEYLISKANSVPDKLFEKYQNIYKNVHFIENESYDIIKHSDFLIIKSGTTTIEAAIIETPFAIVYKANYLSYLIVKTIIKVKHIGLPNIIAKKQIVPELIQQDVTPEKIINTINKYINDKNEYKNMKDTLKDFHTILGNQSAAKNTAEIIKKCIESYYS